MMVFAPLAPSSFSIKEEEGALCAQRFRKFDLAWGSSERRSSLFSQHFLELTASKQGARTRKFPPFRPLFNDDDVGKKPLFRQFSRLHIQFNDSTKLEFSHSLTQSDLINSFKGIQNLEFGASKVCIWCTNLKLQCTLLWILICTKISHNPTQEDIK